MAYGFGGGIMVCGEELLDEPGGERMEPEIESL